MLSDGTATKIILCLVSVFVVFVIALVVFDKMKNKRKKVEQPQNEVDPYSEEIFEQEIVKSEMRVSVVDQFCRVEMVGIRSPKSVEIFTVVFETDEGKSLKFDVLKEIYDGIDVGQRGILTVVNGELYSFELL